MLVEKCVKFNSCINTEYDGYNELQISFDYQKGGVNWFTSDIEQGGLYVYLKPIKRTNGVVSCTMLSSNTLVNGFKVFALPMSRNNKKKIQKIADCFTPEVIEDIKNYYETQDFQKVRDIIKNICDNF